MSVLGDTVVPSQPCNESLRSVMSVVVPVFNEHQTVAHIVDRLLAQDFIREVVVVDDGSDSPTMRILEQIAQDERVVLLRHDCNRGKGAAIRTGFAACQGELIAVQDADLEYSPEDLGKTIQPILAGKADVVYGSRSLANQYANASWVHKSANRALTWLSNRMTGLRLTDMETGCKVFSRPVLDGLSLREERFGIEPEITAKIAAAGWRVQEVAIRYNPRQYKDGKKIGLRDGFRALWCIGRYSLFPVSSCETRVNMASDSEGTRHRDKIVKTSAPSSASNSGFTLVELLVVIAIVAVLMAITIPAAQFTRELDRRKKRSTNPRPSALAKELHDQTHLNYPTAQSGAGWRAEWGSDGVSHLDIGDRLKQTMGRTDIISSYLEQDDSREASKELTPEVKASGPINVIATPLRGHTATRTGLPTLSASRASATEKGNGPAEATNTDSLITSAAFPLVSEVAVRETRLRES